MIFLKIPIVVALLNYEVIEPFWRIYLFRCFVKIAHNFISVQSNQREECPQLQVIYFFKYILFFKNWMTSLYFHLLIIFARRSRNDLDGCQGMAGSISRTVFTSASHQRLSLVSWFFVMLSNFCGRIIFGKVTYPRRH